MKKISLLLILLFIAVSVFGVPARRAPFVVKQSDGTELTIILTGDEALHYYMTIDGKPLFKEANGDFSYASFTDEGVFASTRCLAHDSEKRTDDEKALIASIDYGKMRTSIDKVARQRAEKYRSATSRAASVITKGEVNVPVVLVQFPDYKFSYTKEDIHRMLNEEGFVYENEIANGIGSARDYFIAQSDGQFTPNFIVSDIVTLSQKMAYYGGNDSRGEDKNASYAIKEGIQKANETFDFSICDNDGDGVVEFVYCIYAGYAESYQAAAETIWPHKWQLSYEAGSITVDGVTCDTYACSSELNLNEGYESRYGKLLGGIGTICHEFSHCLGLPDSYDTNGSDNGKAWGMDYWDLMAQGNYAAEGYVPIGYNAYQRAFCGWRELVEINEKGYYSLEPLTQGGVAYKVVNDANSNEFYILENRKRESWDKYLFGQGMLVVHIDYLESAWENNAVNAYSSRPRCTIIPADGELFPYSAAATNEYTQSLKGDVWPGTSNNTELTDWSTPAAKVYTGGYMGKPIKNIKYVDGVITFDFMMLPFENAPGILPASEVGESSFIANWLEVEGAEDYYIELYNVKENNNSELTQSILKEDFVNCVKMNSDITANLNEYTTVKGWSGNLVYSNGGYVRVGKPAEGGVLKTPEIDAGNADVKVLFKSKLCNTADEGVSLSMSIYDSEGLCESLVVSPTVDFREYVLSFVSNGAFYIEFSTVDASGAKRAYIDDVSVEIPLVFEMVLVDEVVTNATSHLFSGLSAGNYAYRVQCMDAYSKSEFSLYEYVTLLETGVCDAVVDDACVEVYTMSGIKVYTGEKGGIPALRQGVYVVKSGGKVSKVFVR